MYSDLHSHKYVASVFIDIIEAYDTVNDKILLKKLSLCGVRGVKLKWFASYLKNQSQSVAIGDHVSSYYNTSIGVPRVYFSCYLFSSYIYMLLI